MPSILLIDHNRASLAAARSFQGLGYTVVAGTSGYCDYMNLSRFVSRSVTLPDLAAAPERVLPALETVCAADPDITAIFSVDETGTRWLARNQASLPTGLTSFNVAQAIVDQVCNKAGAARLAETCGVPVAARQTVDNLADLQAAARDIGAPLVIRAVESNHDLYGRKAVICQSLADFDRIASHWPPEGHQQLMVQRYNPGRRHNVCWNAIQGRLHSAIEMKVLATTTGGRDGYGTWVETVRPHPALQTHATRLAEALGYHGAGSAQFLVDETSGDISFLEINPRLDANIKLAQADMPYIETHAGIMTGEITTPLPDPWAYKAGRRLFWLKGENQTFKTLIRSGRHGELAARAALAVPRSIGAVHALFSLDDPLPAIASHLNPLLQRLPGSLTGNRRPSAPQPLEPTDA
ncbi:ATP-binding protein [Maricaulis sp. CAU 1757]